MKFLSGWEALARALENIMRAAVRPGLHAQPRHLRIIARAAAVLAEEARRGRFDPGRFEPRHYGWVRMPGYRETSIRRLRWLFGQATHERLEEGPDKE